MATPPHILLIFPGILKRFSGLLSVNKVSVTQIAWDQSQLNLMLIEVDENPYEDFLCWERIKKKFIAGKHAYYKYNIYEINITLTLHKGITYTVIAKSKLT